MVVSPKHPIQKVLWTGLASKNVQPFTWIRIPDGLPDPFNEAVALVIATVQRGGMTSFQWLGGFGRFICWGKKKSG